MSFCTALASDCGDLMWGNLYENQFLALQSSCVILIFGRLFRIRGKGISWSYSAWKPVFLFWQGVLLELGVCLTRVTSQETTGACCLLSGCCAFLWRGSHHAPCSQWSCQLFPAETLLADLAHFMVKLAGKNFLLLPSLFTLLNFIFLKLKSGSKWFLQSIPAGEISYMMELYQNSLISTVYGNT